MRKLIAIPTSLVILLLLALALLGPYLIGQQIEPRFKQAIHDIGHKTGFDIKLTSYHRHWFSSRAKAVIENTDEPVELRFNITHGPRYGLDWASIHGFPVIRDERIEKLFDKKPPLRMVVDAHILGKPTFKLDSPTAHGEFRDDHGNRHKLDWAGGQLYINRHDGALLKVPHLKLSNEHGRLHIDNLSMDADGKINIDDLPPSKTKDWNSDIHVELGHLHLQTPDGEFSASGQLANKLRADDEDTLSLSSRLAMHDLSHVYADDSKKPLHLQKAEQKIHIDGIPRPAMTKMLRHIRSLREFAHVHDQTSAQRLEEKIKTTTLAYLPALLADTPSLSWQLKARSPDDDVFHGKLQASLSNGRDWSSMVGSRLALIPILTRLKIDTRLMADRTMIRMLRQNESRPEDLEEFLDGLAGNQLIKADDKRMSTHIHYDAPRNKLRINDHKIPPRMQLLLIRSLLGL